MKPTLLASVAIAVLLAPEVRAAVSYTTPGSTYQENFDSLPNTPVNTSIQGSIPWTDDSTSTPTSTSLPGWYLYHPIEQTEGGANGHQRLRIGTGSANTGSFWSYGAASSTDRALGSLASNTMATNPLPHMFIGLRLRNDTGSTLQQFTLSYNGEQWRDGGATTPNSQNLDFMWSTSATTISDPDDAFTAESNLGFTSPVFLNTASGAAVDGNTSGRVVVGPFTVEGINWAPGTDLWLRWADLNNAGNDHGFAIDDLVFTAAVPEPSVVSMLGLAAAALLLRRRR